MPILQKQNFKASIHPKFKMSWWKLPRILLNAKITIIPYSGLLFYYRKTEKSSKSHTGIIWYRMKADTPDTPYCCVPSILVDDFTILSIQPNLLSRHSRHTVGFNAPASFSVSCVHSALANAMGVEVMCDPPQTHPLPQCVLIDISPQLDRMEKRLFGWPGKRHVDCGDLKNISANSF